MTLNFAECDRARLARDPRYDGQFFTGVRTTRIYCRPVCPAKPLSANVCYFVTPKRPTVSKKGARGGTAGPALSG